MYVSRSLFDAFAQFKLLGVMTFAIAFGIFLSRSPSPVHACPTPPHASQPRLCRVRTSHTRAQPIAAVCTLPSHSRRTSDYFSLFCPQHARQLVDLCDIIFETIIAMIKAIILFTPIGVWSLIGRSITRANNFPQAMANTGARPIIRLETLHALRAALLSANTPCSHTLPPACAVFVVVVLGQLTHVLRRLRGPLRLLRAPEPVRVLPRPHAHVGDGLWDVLVGGDALDHHRMLREGWRLEGAHQLCAAHRVHYQHGTRASHLTRNLPVFKSAHVAVVWAHIRVPPHSIRTGHSSSCVLLWPRTASASLCARARCHTVASRER
jgi:hypothetical protein